MIYIRTILAISILLFCSGLGARDMNFIAWLYDDVRAFESYGDAESFARVISWVSIFLFLACCLFCK